MHTHTFWKLQLTRLVVFFCPSYILVPVEWILLDWSNATDAALKGLLINPTFFFALFSDQNLAKMYGGKPYKGRLIRSYSMNNREIFDAAVGIQVYNR